SNRLELPQGSPQHLADHRFWQLLAELYARGNFVRREALSAEGAQLRFGCRVLRAEHDPRLDHFPFGLVCDTSHTDFGNRRVVREHFLDLARPHLESARLDQILLAIDDEQIAIFVEVAQIAGMEPAPRAALVDVVAEHADGLVGSVPVADHQLRRGKGNFTNLPRWQDARAFVGVIDANVDVWQGHPDRTILIRALHRIDAQGHHRFRQRVAFDDAAACDRFEAPFR